jgi:prolyl oligopeptidase
MTDSMPPRKPGSAALFALLALFAALAPTARSQAPEPEDPYRWLEEIDGERSLEWVREHNAKTAKRLEAHPGFPELYAQALAALDAESRIPEVEQRGDQLYNLWRDATHPRGVYRRTTLEELRKADPSWQTVLDLDALSAGGEAWVFKGMSCLPKAYRHCLALLSPGGGDAVVVREFDMETLDFVAGGFELPVAKSQVSWVDRDTLFVGTDFGPGSMTESGYPRTVRLWKRGTPVDRAPVLYEASVESVSTAGIRLRTEGRDIDLVRDGLSFWTSHWHHLLDGELVRLELPESVVLEDGYRGRLVLSLKEDWTRDGATMARGSVVLARPEALHAGAEGEARRLEVLFEPSSDTVVEEVNAAGDGILITVLENVRGRLYRYREEGPRWLRETIPFPDNGAVHVATTDDGTGAFFARYESFVTPPTLYHAAPPEWTPRPVKSQAPAFDGSRFEVEQSFATSADGTRVPYFVVRPKGIELDGGHPTHIFSYGGFRNSLTPSYSGSYEALQGAYGRLWLERGGVFVLANIRGGGEFGPDWHTAALLENRHKAFEDFEAVAGDLIARRITSPEHLGIEGRSNGGLLVAATTLRRPDLYGAVICGVPLTDMRRYHRLLAGASWMAEFGDPDDPGMWKYIETYSPYHNVVEGRDYPPIFFFTSTRDDRVHPGHARKMAARMEELGYEVWYYENIEGGHGGSSTNDQLAYRLALAYSHLWEHLGVPLPPEGGRGIG